MVRFVIDEAHSWGQLGILKQCWKLVPIMLFTAIYTRSEVNEICEKLFIDENNFTLVCVAISIFGIKINSKNIRTRTPMSITNLIQEAGHVGRDENMVTHIIFYNKKDIRTNYSIVTEYKEIESIINTIVNDQILNNKLIQASNKIFEVLYYCNSQYELLKTKELILFALLDLVICGLVQEKIILQRSNKGSIGLFSSIVVVSVVHDIQANAKYKINNDLLIGDFTKDNLLLAKSGSFILKKLNNKFEKTFARYFNEVITNDSLTTGIWETFTDNFVNFLLSNLEFNINPLLMRLQLDYSFSVFDKEVTTKTEFSIEKNKEVLFIDENNRLHSLKFYSEYGESQISVKILACAFINFSSVVSPIAGESQMIYATKVIGTRFVFYKGSQIQSILARSIFNLSLDNIDQVIVGVLNVK
ncbi:1181_t:CDS:2 [Diversispora eburnea]|uniref:1181_t:CDS:1 n=1 Tax=Diversispora eburnea TaxID=1213867 RepID=A0A9N8ZUA2_9GLOM|nr:1181_t:CDS:2 [Diversispora eburnea]